MVLFKAYDTNVEVNGETVISILDGLSSFRESAEKLLADNGIPDPQPGQWFAQQSWLDCFKLIAEKLGTIALKNIGKAIPRNAQWPDSAKDIVSGFESIDIAYHINHRKLGKQLYNVHTGEMNEGIGHYKFEKTSEKSGIMVCDDPYPDAFDLGIIESVGKKFASDDEHVKVTIDETKEIREKGADSTTYLIEW